jgi:peptidoglycan/xylan/chitin deacetylase (PgdA/CDA1 family)
MPIQPPKILERIFPEILWRGPSNDNSIYLTFDDGPDPDITSMVLDILSEHDVRASFFLVGSRISGVESVVERLGQAGHLLANHGYSHRKLGWVPSRTIAIEIADTEHILASNGWSYHRLFRPPFGHFRPGITNMLHRIGYRMVMWSLMPGDYRNLASDRLLQRTLRNLHPGAINVLHDHSRNPGHMLQMLPNLLKELADRDYACKRLDEIKGVELFREKG